MSEAQTVSARAAAEMLDMDDRSLRRAVARGELPAEKGPKRNSPLRILEADVRSFAAARGSQVNDVGGQLVDAEPEKGHDDRPARLPIGASAGEVKIALSELLQLQERLVRAEERLGMVERYARVTGDETANWLLLAILGDASQSGRNGAA